jgi:hypothetical protein
MICSPLPDVLIPDIRFTEFVLARAGELGDKPASINAAAGRSPTRSWCMPTGPAHGSARQRGSHV